MNKRTIALVISLVILVTVFIGAFFVWKNSNTDSKIESKTETVTDQTANLDKTSAQYISGNSKLSTFTESLNTAGLFGQLETVGPYTIFAPNNDAFTNMPNGYNDILFKSTNPQVLKNVMSYHIVDGSLESSALTNGQKIKTQNGQEVIIELNEGSIYLLDAKGTKSKVKTANIKTSNGVVYIIDGVLLPQ